MYVCMYVCMYVFSVSIQYGEGRNIVLVTHHYWLSFKLSHHPNGWMLNKGLVMFPPKTLRAVYQNAYLL